MRLGEIKRVYDLKFHHRIANGGIPHGNTSADARGCEEREDLCCQELAKRLKRLKEIGREAVEAKEQLAGWVRGIPVSNTSTEARGCEERED